MADSAARGNREAGTRSAGVRDAGTPPVMRERLPIPVPRYVGLTTYDAKDPNTKYPPIARLRPPPGAPSVTGTPRPYATSSIDSSASSGTPFKPNKPTTKARPGTQ